MKCDPDKTLLIFSTTASDRRYILSSLDKLFREYIHLVPVDEAEACALRFVPRAVLATDLSQSIARRLFPDSQVILIKRIVTGHNLEQVLLLPEQEPVLVASHLEQSSREIIGSLRSMGVEKLRLVPYWQGCDLDTSGFSTVIYTGFQQFAPAGMRHYIDLGKRDLSIMTIVSILRAFDLPATCLDYYDEDKMRVIVDTCYQLYNSLQESDKLRDNFERICAISANTMFCIDHLGRITMLNPAAERTLHLDRKKVLGRPLRHALQAFPNLIRQIGDFEEVEDVFLPLRGRDFMLTANHLSSRADSQLLVMLTPVEFLQRSEAKARQRLHAKGFFAKHQFDDILGDSESIRRAKSLARRYAHSDATILITGESGTGKELFAQSIHNVSLRWNRPFVGINFAALPESLAESELFGYEEGAFTGASKGGKAGLFEIAHLGTIFLDEIGDATPAMQARLLRVIEEREIIRVGSARVIPVDVRIISATNQDLPDLVSRGRFRHDLYYRLCILPLHIPPLRERRQDIPPILQASQELARLDRGTVHRIVSFVEAMRYDWPGNVRELKSILQYISVMCHDSPSGPADLDFMFEELEKLFFSAASGPAGAVSAPSVGGPDEEQRAILAAIGQLAASGRSAGRYSLSGLPQLRALGLTEARIKAQLQRLAKEGYLEIKRTRQGVALTPRGAAYLEEHR